MLSLFWDHLDIWHIWHVECLGPSLNDTCDPIAVAWTTGCCRHQVRNCGGKTVTGRTMYFAPWQRMAEIHHSSHSSASDVARPAACASKHNFWSRPCSGVVREHLEIWSTSMLTPAIYKSICRICRVKTMPGILTCSMMMRDWKPSVMPLTDCQTKCSTIEL